MDLLPTAEQQQIIDTAESFLAREFPVNDLLQLPAGHSCLSTGKLRALADLGWLAIGLAEEAGGVGYGLPEETLLFAELGKHLVSPATLASVLAARMANDAGNEQMLNAITSGGIRVALGSAIPVQERQAPESFLVYEACDAELLLIVSDTQARLFTLATLEQLSSDRCIDPTLQCGVYRTSQSRPLLSVDCADEDIFLRGALLTSAGQLGIAEATLSRSVSYAKEREQYGKPIGAFQAIKHYCAEMATRSEAIRAMLYHASITVQDKHSGARFDVHTVKALADEYAQLNANTAVQIHGGMGYTQEMDIHLFVKRTQVLATLFGSRRYHLRKLLAEPAPKDDL